MTGTLADAIGRLYRSWEQAGSPIGLPDAATRDPSLAGRLLESAGLDPTALPLAVVAGSKGKGSTVRQAVAPLVAAGLRVGWVTSPHLVDYRERIRLGDACIPAADLVEGVAALEPHLAALEASLPPGAYLGPHAGLVALALRWFLREGVDVAVFEAGRGGRFDEVTALRAPFAAIPSVLLEHRLELGPSIRDVAWHKAGVATPGSRVAVGRASRVARSVVARELAQRDVRAEWLGRELRAGPSGTVPGRARAPGQAAPGPDALGDGPVTLVTPDASHDGVRLGLRGAYQQGNAVLGVRLAEWLHRAARGTALPGAAVRDGLARVTSPGRLQEVAWEGRGLLLDTAVHRSSVPPILAWMAARRAAGARVVLACSVPTDKDWRAVLDLLAPAADLVLVARPAKASLPYDARAIARAVAALPVPAGAGLLAGAAAALGAARAATAPGDAVAAIGTQSFVAECLRHLGRGADELFAPQG